MRFKITWKYSYFKFRSSTCVTVAAFVLEVPFEAPQVVSTVYG
jgi:hypothetical protein